MITGIHFLLTYNCPFECDHCFLYCSPQSEGTFTIRQIKTVFDEIDKMQSIDWIYFEGGEPFLYYPIMIEGMRLAKKRKQNVGIVTNAYFAKDTEDAILWLEPLGRIGIDDLSVSNDAFHQDDESPNTAQIAYDAAVKLNLPTGSICIEPPEVKKYQTDEEKGEAIIGGGVVLRGRAVEKLTEGLPRRPCREFGSCPHEELEHPKRVHIDSFGHVHICQGISMGNMWQTPLSELASNYDASKHPIAGPLVEGGPMLLAEKYGIKHEEVYVDHCHMCFEIRKKLIDKFPEYLAPRQVYGLK